jgi:hypothetical protein
MRLAKLLITMVVAHLISIAEFEPSQHDGADNTIIPLWDRNSLRMEIKDDPVYLRYKLRKGA